jgi:hypothetical protein
MKRCRILRGDVHDSTTLKISDKTLSITKSLEKMLQHLRLPSKIGYTARDHDPSVPHRLWTDAICLYLDRYRTKHRGNLRFGPLYFEGFRLRIWAMGECRLRSGKLGQDPNPSLGAQKGSKVLLIIILDFSFSLIPPSNNIQHTPTTICQPYPWYPHLGAACSFTCLP